jgi:hypothetical protein
MAIGLEPAAGIAADAHRAWDEGHTVFIANLRGGPVQPITPTLSLGWTSGQIEEIEATGWRLAEFEAVEFQAALSIICVFRRADRSRQTPSGSQEA